MLRSPFQTDTSSTLCILPLDLIRYIPIRIFSMATWERLPTELRIAILELVLSSNDSHGKLANYVCVSREWQTYFEPRNFYRLVLSAACVADVGKMAHRCKGMVKHIWLRVELPPYECSACGKAETNGQRRENNQLFTNALRKLMETLHSWEQDDRDLIDEGSILELSVHSPSDLKHQFDYCAFDKDIYPHRFDGQCADDEYSNHLTRELHGNARLGYQCGLVRRRTGGIHELRMFQSIELDFGDIQDEQSRKLPHVQAAKGLLVRRQHYRRFRPQALADIARSLQRLESIHFEPVIRDYKSANDGMLCSPLFCRSQVYGSRKTLIPVKGYQRELGDLIRAAPRLQSLSIFVSHHAFFRRWGFRGPLPALGWTLADESRSLEHLSAAFVSDAADVFHDFLPPGSPKSRPFLDPSRSGVQKALLSSLSPAQRQNLSRLAPDQFEEALVEAAGYASNQIPYSVYRPHWPNLRTLAQTSSYLRSEALEERISDLLEAAAGAAMAMPRLQTMELWNDDLQSGCIFQYCRTGASGRPAIILSSSWDLGLEPRVYAAWERVAQRHSDQAVTITRVQSPNPERLYATTDRLALREQVAHPISLCGFRWRDADWQRAVRYELYPWP